MGDESSTALTPKDRLDVCLKLADAAWRDFDTRRAYEWKANFGLWAGLAGLAVLCLRGDVAIQGAWRTAVMAASIAVGLVYVLLWTPGLHKRNRNDQAVAQSLWTQAAQIATLTRPHEPEPTSTFKNWSHLSQIIITAILLILAGLALFARVGAG